MISLKLSINDFDFLKSFDLQIETSTDKYNKNKLNLFTLKVNSNEFDYKLLHENLLDPLIDFSLSRRIKQQYSNKPGTLTNKAKEKFVDYINNTGELGELLLYCFLETHLNAPKILSKLELKTSNNQYVNGSDGVHFLKLDNGDFQLIFGESKTIKNLTSAITEAFKSIHEFKNETNSKGHNKSGIQYEKSLINDQLIKEALNDDELGFIEKIIYPSRENNFNVDDAFGIFIAYELTINDADKRLPNDEFRDMISQKICAEVAEKFEHIENKITDYKLFGHNFYIYILPMTNLKETKVSIQEGLFR